MPMPRRDTAVFKVLQGLTIHGEMNVDEIIEKVGYVIEKSSKYAMTQLLKRMLVQGYVNFWKGKYYIIEDVKNYVEDVMEISESIDKGEVVMPAYKNVFTPEMKNYNLFANKRGY